MMKVNILETDTGRIREDELRDWSQAALNQLDKAYGYKSFRPGQLEAVNTILNDRDLVAVMPTGSGKKRLLPASRDARRPSRARRVPIARPHARPGAGVAGQGSGRGPHR